MNYRADLLLNFNHGRDLRQQGWWKDLSEVVNQQGRCNRSRKSFVTLFNFFFKLCLYGEEANFYEKIICLKIKTHNGY